MVMDPGEQIKEFDRKIGNLDRRRRQLEAVVRQKQNRKKYEERKARAHRLIGIGAEVESVLERQISKEELGAFRNYLKKAVMIMGAFEPEKVDAPFSCPETIRDG